MTSHFPPPQPNPTLIEHVLQASLVAVIAFLGFWMVLGWGFRTVGKGVGRLFEIA